MSTKHEHHNEQAQKGAVQPKAPVAVTKPGLGTVIAGLAVLPSRISVACFRTTDSISVGVGEWRGPEHDKHEIATATIAASRGAPALTSVRLCGYCP